MPHPECAEENEMHNVLWDLVIQTYRLISDRLPDQVIVSIKGKNVPNCELWSTGRPQNRIKRKRKER